MTNFSESNDYALTYILPSIVVFSSLTEILAINYGFKYFDTALVVPIFKASIVFHNTMWGGVLLKEFFYYSALNIVMYSIGIFVCILGILIMLMAREQEEKEYKSIKNFGVNESLIKQGDCLI